MCRVINAKGSPRLQGAAHDQPVDVRASDGMSALKQPQVLAGCPKGGYTKVIYRHSW